MSYTYSATNLQIPMASFFSLRLGNLLLVVFLWAAPRLSADGDWSSWLGSRMDSVWSSEERDLDLNGRPWVLRWSAAIGSGYAGPALSGAHVVVMDWQPDREENIPKDVFERGKIPGKESIHCLDVVTGKVRWSHAYREEYTISYPAGPRATPLMVGDTVIAVGAEGRLSALDLSDGNLRWEKDFTEDFGAVTSTWGHAAHPLHHEGRVICLVGGQDGAGVVAMDIQSGKEIWRSLELKQMGYCPPSVIQFQGRDQILVWSGDGVTGLAPSSGQVEWTFPWELRFALAVPTPRQKGNDLFLTSFYNGALMLDLGQSPPRPRWRTQKVSERDTTHLNSIMGSPFLHQGHIYGICSYGELRCLESASGRRIWQTLEATTGEGKPQERWANVFVIKNGSADRYLLFNESGELIDCRMNPEGYRELGRMHLIEPNGKDLRRRPIVWSHPAFGDSIICVRNDDSIRCFEWNQ